MNKSTPSLPSLPNEIELKFLADNSKAAISHQPTAADPLSIAPVEWVGLSAPQAKAIELLASGHSITETAEAAGVGRATLYRWLKGDAAFIAAYNAWQQDVIDTARGRLLSLSTLAVTAVEKSLQKADAKTAMTILQKLGVLDRPIPGPTEPAEVQRQQTLQRRKAKAALAKEEARTDMEEMFPM